LQDGETPLHCAVVNSVSSYGYYKVVQVLVQAGADVNAATKVRHFPIFAFPRCTVTVHSVTTAELLVRDACADVSRIENKVPGVRSFHTRYRQMPSPTYPCSYSYLLLAALCIVLSRLEKHRVSSLRQKKCDV
jgi:hypothetical protein